MSVSISEVQGSNCYAKEFGRDMLETPFSQLWELDQLAVVDGYQEDELSLHSSY